ncbi:unnamed protein product [Miscanthus lutarioriparius]|uniref:Uncharacterized protein n=1 Tax=Miscanthus lutarioriparius TaxID=422564 RepID=A0A811NZN6_9POAL|nr:unnamed protein product [Miscanthus lutarioriparius]
MASRGEKACMLYTYDCKFLMFSTCTITKAGIGGPLLDFDGNIVGMNFYDNYASGTPFLPWDVILNVLGHFKKKRTVDEAGLDDYASTKLDWTIAGDRSVMLNSWHVPLPTWYHPDDLKRHDYKMELENAGTGGPLLDFDGKFVGMNFYDKTIDEAGLDDYASNKLDWTIAGDRSVKFNRWPVPLPTWYRPDGLKRHDYKMELKNVRSRKIFL